MSENGLWLLEKEGRKFAVLFDSVNRYGCVTGIQFQIATANPEGTRITQEFFKHLEDSIVKAESYRGKRIERSLGFPVAKPASTGTLPGESINGNR